MSCSKYRRLSHPVDKAVLVYLKVYKGKLPKSIFRKKRTLGRIKSACQEINKLGVHFDTRDSLRESLGFPYPGKYEGYGKIDSYGKKVKETR